MNRLYEEDGIEKQFGFIIDYEGLLGELDKALTTYTAFQGFDASDLAGTVHDVREQIRKLPNSTNSPLWDLFRPVRNKRDMEQFEQFLADEAVRRSFTSGCAPLAVVCISRSRRTRFLRCSTRQELTR